MFVGKKSSSMMYLIWSRSVLNSQKLDILTGSRMNRQGCIKELNRGASILLQLGRALEDEKLSNEVLLEIVPFLVDLACKSTVMVCVIVKTDEYVGTVL